MSIRKSKKFSLPSKRRYEFDGVAVNPANGSELKDKTGMLRSFDPETGELLSELEYRNGIHIGHEMTIDMRGDKNFRVVNEKGNADGRWQKVSRDGRLLSDEMYRNGRRDGWSKRFHDNERVSRVAFYKNNVELSEIEYTNSGAVQSLKCGAEAYGEEDKKLCGFGGSEVETRIERKNGEYELVTYLLGRRLSRKLYSPKDILVYQETETKPGHRVVKKFSDEAVLLELSDFENERDRNKKSGFIEIYHESGKLTERRVYKDARILKREVFFLNGKQKINEEYSSTDGHIVVTYLENFDTGQPFISGRFKKSSFREFGVSPNDPVGLVKRYHPSGTLESEENFNFDSKREGDSKQYGEKANLLSHEVYKNGVLLRRTTWDEDGKKTAEDEFYEDGSRK